MVQDTQHPAYDRLLEVAQAQGEMRDWFNDEVRRLQAHIRETQTEIREAAGIAREEGLSEDDIYRALRRGAPAPKRMKVKTPATRRVDTGDLALTTFEAIFVARQLLYAHVTAKVFTSWIAENAMLDDDPEWGDDLSRLWQLGQTLMKIADDARRQRERREPVITTSEFGG